MPQETPHDVFGAVQQHDIYTGPIVSLSLNGSAEHWYYTLPRHSIADWDIMANRFYRTFFTPQPIHLDARTWDEGASNEAVMLSLQTPQEMDVDEILNADLKPFPDMRPRDLFLEEVYFTPFLLGYRFLTFVIYRGMLIL